jgi:hypothetical protein
VQLVKARRAFEALERPIRAVNRMLGYPSGDANLALNHAALKSDLALTTVGNDLFNTVSGTSRYHAAENGHKRNEHRISPVSSWFGIL